MAEASAPDTSLSAGSEIVPDTSLSAGSQLVPETLLSDGSEFVQDASLSAGSEFVPETSLSAGSEVIPDTSLSAGSDHVQETSLSAGSEFIFDNVCQPCSTEGSFAEAEKYCQDCCQHLCVQCTGFHKKLASLKDHKLVGSADAHKQIKATFVADIEFKVGTGFLSFFSPKPYSAISGLALVSVDRLVAADFNNKRLLLVDTTKKKVISEFKAESVPWDVTVCGGAVAATLPAASKIIFLKCDDGLVYVRELCVKGRCWGIDCVDDKLYVVYSLDKKLEVMTVTGDVLQMFHTDNHGEELFQGPCYVTESTANQRIYVSDWGKDGLKVLGLDGKVKDKYNGSGEGVGLGQLAVDTTDVMYLCDLYNSTIHLLSPQCEKVKNLLTEQDGIQRPRSVCYCESTRKLYIGTRNGIKVYQIS